MQNQNRRNFLKFLGASSLSLSQLGLLNSLVSCNIDEKLIFPSVKDDVILLEGLTYEVLISWGEKINKDEVFGFNNDYINIVSLNAKELIMWVNHEYIHPLFVSSMERSKENIDKEMKLVGGSLLHLEKKNNQWVLNPNSKFNKGVRGDTPIPFANNVKIKNSQTAIGTLANCAGGKTPWNTFLTCEENYDMFYGETNSLGEKIEKSWLQWDKHYPNPPEHYGWVVEIEPQTGKAQKHTNLGRFAHECATPIISKSGHVCVYSGDDAADEHLYKFISTSSTNFDNGTLYVADLNKKKWLPLDINLSPILKEKFKSNLEVHTYAREAAKLLGATPLNRPEDIEIHPETNDVYIALTNNKKRGDFHGQILKISEKKADHSALTFEYETFLMGSRKSGFSCPDNLAFDSKGNLWFTTDISGSALNSPPYTSFGNNGLFIVPIKGKKAGQVVQIASAPTEAEFTGICFDPDEDHLFLSVQHPGEKTKDLNRPTSTWPTGKMPKPSVITISGARLKSIIDGDFS